MPFTTKYKKRKSPAPRCGHCTFEHGGLLYIFGGYGEKVDPYLDTVKYIYHSIVDMWVYSRDLNKWFIQKNSGGDCLPKIMVGATATRIGDNVYLFGGFVCHIGSQNALYKLDLRRRRWQVEHAGTFSNGGFYTLHSDVPSPRDKHSSWAYFGKLYTFGGYGPNINTYLHDHGTFVHNGEAMNSSGWNNQLFIYNPEDETWSNPKCTGEIPCPRAAHATTRIGNRAYLFGGRHCADRLNDLYMLDLDTLQWTKIQPSNAAASRWPVGRSWHTFNAVSNTQICLFGGFTSAEHVLGDTWLYDVISGEWQSIGNSADETRRKRLWHTAAPYPDGTVAVFGGCTENLLKITGQPSSKLLQIRTRLPTLKTLCLSACIKHASSLINDWDTLPQALTCELLDRYAVKQRAERGHTHYKLLEVHASDG